MDAADRERLAALEKLVAQHASSLDTSWMLSSGALIVLMQLGFALLEAGHVREHNVLATLMKNVLDFVLGVVVAFLWGYQIAHGVSPMSLDIMSAGHHHREFFFYQSFQATAATIVSGAMAERTTMWGYGLFSTVVSGLVFAFAARWTWGGGWLSELDPPFHDFAGSGVVHAIGGITALVGAIAVGPREGRWELGRATDFVPHNIPSIVMGTLLLWVGWYGFNPGSSHGISDEDRERSAANAAMVTTVAAAFSGFVVLVIALVTSRRVEIPTFCNGLLGGLVAITAGCDAIDPCYSPIVGCVAAVVCMGSASLAQRCGIDDVVDSFAVHGACGIWGLFAEGFFDRERGLLSSGHGWGLMRSQLIGTLALVAVAVVPSMLFVKLLLCSGVLRARTELQRTGLDADFGLNAYVRRAEKMQRLHTTGELLVQHGHSPAQLLEALIGLRGIIYRPFTPQAADNKLEGELLDVIEHFSEPDKTIKHLAFVSHHKADCGDAARIFVDSTRRLLSRREQMEWTSQGVGDLSRLQGPTGPTVPAGTASEPIGGHFSPMMRLNVGARSCSTPSQDSQPVMRPIDDAGTPRMTVKRTISAKSSGGGGGGASPSSAGSGMITQNQLLFLDSSNLKDLDNLLVHVETSANFVLLLSRRTLQRPWCCAELCRAFHMKRNIILVLVEWPKDDMRSFRFPLDLETEIWNWMEHCAALQTKGSLKRAATLLSPTKSYAVESTASERSRSRKRPSVEVVVESEADSEDLELHLPEADLKPRLPSEVHRTIDTEDITMGPLVTDTETEEPTSHEEPGPEDLSDIPVQRERTPATAEDPDEKVAL